MSLKDKPLGDLFDDYHDNPEYELFDSVINEFTDIGGFPIYYGVKTNVENADYLYGEDTNETFAGPYRSRVVYEPTQEEEILNSFGISSDDTLEYLQIPKSKFQEEVAQEYGDNEYIPKPGDTIQLLGNGKLYNITDIGAEQKVFQAKKLVWELICRPHVYAEEGGSAEDVLYSEPPSGFFDETNTTIPDTEPLSAYGNNKEIEEEAKEDYGYNQENIDRLYGYDTLD